MANINYESLVSLIIGELELRLREGLWCACVRRGPLSVDCVSPLRALGESPPQSPAGRRGQGAFRPQLFRDHRRGPPRRGWCLPAPASRPSETPDRGRAAGRSPNPRPGVGVGRAGWSRRAPRPTRASAPPRLDRTLPGGSLRAGAARARGGE